MAAENRRSGGVAQVPEFVANNLGLVLLFIALLTLLAWNLLGSSLAGVPRVDPAEATRLLNQEKAVLVDLRGGAEFSSGHVLSARNIPAAELESRRGELQKHRKTPVILCCARDADGVKAGRILKQAGHERIYSLKGGVQSWRNANLPLVRD